MSHVDLHCHTAASFDGVAEPGALVARARERGLTHLAITDHGTIEGAVRAAAEAPPGIVVIVGEEVLTLEGDLIFLFLQQALPRGLAARDAIDAGREQGALVGIPHPYDRTRRSVLDGDGREPIVELVDWVETVNGRVGRQATNRRAGDLAARRSIPGVGVSDAHALIEVGRVRTVMAGDPDTPAGLLASLRGPLSIVQAEVNGPRRSPFHRLLRRRTRVVAPRR